LKYSDLRDFISQLERDGQLRRISQPRDPKLEITEVCDRTLRAGGPALLFENPVGYDIPVLANLFGTAERVALGIGQNPGHAQGTGTTQGHEGRLGEITDIQTSPEHGAEGGQARPLSGPGF